MLHGFLLVLVIVRRCTREMVMARCGASGPEAGSCAERGGYPEARELALLGGDGLLAADLGEGVDDIRSVVGGEEGAEAESGRAGALGFEVWGGAGEAVGKRCAVEPCAGEHAVARLENAGELLRGEGIVEDAHDAHAEGGIGGAKEAEARDAVAREGGEHGGEEFEFVLADGGDAAVEQPGDGLAKAGDADGVVAACLVLLGHEIGVGFELGSVARAALADGCELVFDTRRDAQAAGALRAQEALVAREGEQVDVGGGHVDGDVAQGLRAVDEEEQAVGHSPTACAGMAAPAGTEAGADLADSGQVLNGAGDVACVVDTDQYGLARADGLADVVGVDQAGGGVGIDLGPIEERVGEGGGVQGAEDGVVFENGGDDMKAGAGAAGPAGVDENALDGEVERVGGVVGEDDVVRAGEIDEGGDALAAEADEAAHLAGLGVGAAARGSHLGHSAEHRLSDGRGLREACSGVVEIASFRLCGHHVKGYVARAGPVRGAACEQVRPCGWGCRRGAWP